MPPLAPKNILVVDDEPFVCEAIKMLLSHDGHQVETAANGEEALTKCGSAQFDVIFTDFAMPGMKGDELADAIKVLSPKTPVIMLTAFPPSRQPASIELILTKPFLMDSLRDGLRQVFARRIPGK